MARALTQTEFLIELEPVVEENLNRHLGVAKEWFPHEYIPWDDARTFDGILGGTPWRPEDSTIPEVARTSLLVNLLTEDNLPSYHHEIATTFGRDGAWGTWVGRWTAEEGRHAIVIRDYLIASRALDPTALERARMAHMENGFQTEYGTMLGQLAYVSFQELATRIAHRNTGKASGDETCERILARVAADENLHMLFYRNLLGAALELDPNQTMRAITDVVTSFQMPGAGMAGFARMSMAIAHAGIYDLRSHKDEVLMPVLRQWKVFEKEGLDPEGEKARQELAEFLDNLEVTARKFEERREARRAREAAK
ncbi:acyl-ACP desaturase [Herbidospora daliensis]|uniref:acyl-ACP desaturase n=1 Tax=Herbidospora daliensis TaxID=295585 RepID=UPI000784B486|nr:acyl-ACP desaturase [Herbidospora daliensis]